MIHYVCVPNTLIDIYVITEITEQYQLNSINFAELTTNKFHIHKHVTLYFTLVINIKCENIFFIIMDLCSPQCRFYLHNK